MSSTPKGIGKSDPTDYIDLTTGCCGMMKDTKVIIFKVIQPYEIKCAPMHDDGYAVLKEGMRLTCGFKKGSRVLVGFQDGSDKPTSIYGDEDKAKIAGLLLSGDHAIYIDVISVDSQILDSGDLLTKGIGSLSIICSDDLEPDSNVDIMSPDYSPVAGRSANTPKKGRLADCPSPISKDYIDIVAKYATPKRRTGGIVEVAQGSTDINLFSTPTPTNRSIKNVISISNDLGGSIPSTPTPNRHQDTTPSRSLGQRLFGLSSKVADHTSSPSFGSASIASPVGTQLRGSVNTVNATVVPKLEDINSNIIASIQELDHELAQLEDWSPKLEVDSSRLARANAQNGTLTASSTLDENIARMRHIVTDSRARIDLRIELQNTIDAARRDMYYSLNGKSVLDTIHTHDIEEFFKGVRELDTIPQPSATKRSVTKRRSSVSVGKDDLFNIPSSQAKKVKGSDEAYARKDAGLGNIKKEDV